MNPQPCVPINRSALAHKSANSEGSCRSSWPATENMAKAAETTTALLDERPEATKEKKRIVKSNFSSLLIVKLVLTWWN